jgi:hypothetical protein
MVGTINKIKEVEHAGQALPLFEATWQRAVTGIMNEFGGVHRVQLITAWVHHKVEELCQDCGCQQVTLWHCGSARPAEAQPPDQRHPLPLHRMAP